MLMIEISPPFQWKPTIFRGKTGMISRVMWGWFAVAYTPMDFNEFIEQTAQATLELTVCGACGQTWTGEACGQKNNEWPFPTCYPILSKAHDHNI